MTKNTKQTFSVLVQLDHSIYSTLNQIYKKSQGKYVPLEITIQDEKVRIFCYLKNAWTVDEILFWVLLPKFQLVPQGLTDWQRQLENIKSVSLLARIESVLVSMKALGDVHNHLKKTSDQITPLE